MSEQKQTPIKINGRDYIYETLPPKVQSLLQFHTRWENELKQQRLEAAKTEAALRDIQREIGAEMQQIESLVAGTEASND